MIDVGTRERIGIYRLKICQDNRRDQATLLPLIERLIEPETTIITDLRREYNGLNDLGYKHLTVNHSYNFVNPETFAHTQNIESSWRPFKKWLNRGGVHKSKLAEHMCKFLWRREVRRNDGLYFESLIRNISQINTW